MLPLMMTYFFQQFFFSRKNIKGTPNLTSIGGGQIRGALFNFFFVFVVKKSPFLHRPDPHKKVYRDLTEKKQDLTEMSIILMVLTEI